MPTERWRYAKASAKFGLAWLGTRQSSTSRLYLRVSILSYIMLYDHNLKNLVVRNKREGSGLSPLSSGMMPAAAKGYHSDIQHFVIFTWRPFRDLCTWYSEVRGVQKCLDGVLPQIYWAEG